MELNYGKGRGVYFDSDRMKEEAGVAAAAAAAAKTDWIRFPEERRRYRREGTFDLRALFGERVYEMGLRAESYNRAAPGSLNFPSSSPATVVAAIFSSHAVTHPLSFLSRFARSSPGTSLGCKMS
ncbi:unnamed protein product [Linum trigynum]|uniref:Uncharacterized protein n=1 Tax=Linum trigynum TaxID=586398 RepID=A0AAV2G5Q4_9ROSI